jgi:hypothetical protein
MGRISTGSCALPEEEPAEGIDLSCFSVDHAVCQRNYVVFQLSVAAGFHIRFIGHSFFLFFFHFSDIL